MAYNPTTWQDLPSQATPLNAVNLNKIEQGISDAHDLIAAAQSTSFIALNPVTVPDGGTYIIDASNAVSLTMKDTINATGGTIYIDLSGTPGQTVGVRNLIAQHVVDIVAASSVNVILVTGAGKFASATQFSIAAGQTARFRFEYANNDVPIFAALSGVTGGSSGGGGSSYVHTQASANAVWTVVHNLGYNPANMFAQDDVGETILGYNVTYDNVNQLTITHAYALAGTVTVG